MSTIFGAIGLNDTDRVFAATAGQQVVLDLINQYTTRLNADMEASLNLFVGQTTENYKLRYKFGGNGYMQRRGLQAQPGARKAYGGYDVAMPLEDFADQIAADDVSMAYMTAGDLQRHLSTITTNYANTVRFEILNRLFYSANPSMSFIDPLWGTLTVKGLANGDTDTYPPVLGSLTEATENHYLESGYAASGISDTNNPLVTIVNEIEEHFGAPTGGSNVVIFINNAQTAKITALSAFDEVIDSNIRQGDNVSVPISLPNVPGRIIGRGSGAWVVEWRWIPANYMLGISLEVEAPLYMRVDPADTGLGRGLQLVARENQFPFESAFWRARFGVGAANRLNGVALELGTGGTYTDPTIA
jgi:hypothetical protein